MRNLERRWSGVPVSGWVDSGFEPVRDVFLANFEHGREVGAAVSVYRHGQPVVELTAGFRALASDESYSGKTLQPIFSATKGVTALAANMLADRGQLDFDSPVESYWPEFGQAGKSHIPVRWLLTHQSGIVGLDQTISREQLLNWNCVVERLAAQRPDWEPGARHGYHSMTFGFLVGEVIRRITGCSVGEYVAREIAGPLRAEIFIGLPQRYEARVASAVLPELGGEPPKLADSGPYAMRALNWISPPLTPAEANRREVRAAEIPAANGIANARSLARMFASMIGEVDGVRCLSSHAMNRARQDQWRGFDVVMGVENALGLGFLLPAEWCPLGGARLVWHRGIWRHSRLGKSRVGIGFRVHSEPLRAWSFRPERGGAEQCSNQMCNGLGLMWSCTVCQLAGQGDGARMNGLQLLLNPRDAGIASRSVSRRNCRTLSNRTAGGKADP
jgi:CubicO group peptidase (beta-lactamase class C family)